MVKLGSTAPMGAWRRTVASVSALTLVASLAAMFTAAAPAGAADPPPPYGGYVIDGAVPDGGTINYPDDSGNTAELGPKNGEPQQLGKIHTSPTPMLELTNPNGTTDLMNVWLDTSVVDDQIWLYAAWQRETNTGSGVVMFEFQKGDPPAACDYANATQAELIAGCNPWENRQAGDFIIVWDQQGNTTEIIKRTFALVGGVLTLDDGVELGGSDVKAAYGDNELRGELAINLSATVFPSEPDSCLTIANVIPMTGTGNSSSADVKDTVLADTSGTYISNCGAVRVTKQTDPDGQAGSFPISAGRTGGGTVRFDGSTSAGVTLDGDGDVDDIEDLLPGSDYRLTETVPVGWELLSVVCDGGPDIKDSGTFTVVAGELNSCTVTNKKALPALTLVKTGGPTPYSSVGQQLSYSYELENTGNVTLSAPFAVSDDKVAVSCAGAPATLAVGGTVLCTATAAVTQANLDAGALTNTATGTASYAGQTVTSNPDSVTLLADQNPALSLDKTANKASYSAVGEQIGYSYLVTNTGNVTLAGPVTVTDDRVTVTCPVGGLAPTVSTTCTATHVVDQDDLDDGSITNTATAHANGTSSNPDAVTVSAAQDRSLLLEKSTDATSYDSVDDVLAYDYDVTNTGNVTLAGPVTVTDDKTTVGCPAGDLSPGETITCTSTYDVNQADLDAGAVKNTAKATADGVDSNEDWVEVPAEQSPELTLDKDTDTVEYSAVGESIPYTYLVTNTGNVTLTGPVTVDDDLTTVTCPATTPIAPGQSVSCSAAHVVTQQDLDDGTITNIATATATFDGDDVTSLPDTVTVPARQLPDLGIEKSATPTTYTSAGQVIGYEYVVTNTGNVTLDGPFTVVDDKSSDESCPDTASLAPDAFITCAATYEITQADMDSGSVTNIAYATGGGAQSDTDTATVTAVQTPVLAIAKTASPGTYSEVGQEIDYSYVVANAGNVTLSGPFTVTDDRATASCPVTASLAPGASIVCAASYEITQADIDGGEVTNVARAWAFHGEEPISSEPDDETVDAVQSTGLLLVKRALDAGYAQVGDVLEYEYDVTNTGNVTLSGPFTISDDKSSDEACPVTATLAPDQTITCTASYPVTQADLDGGSVTNLATASNGVVTSNPDSETVPAVQSPALTVVKTAGEEQYSEVGDVLTYEYVVTNSGNVTLAGPFTIADDKSSDESCPQTVSLAPQGSITCEASYTVTQADLDAGSVTNVAAASNGTVTSPPDDATVPAVQTPLLGIAKTADPLTYDSVGDVVGYEYVVTNIGNVTLAGPFTVADDRTTATCPSTASLLPGGSLVCAATYVVDQDDLDDGSVTNVARAFAQFDGDPVSSEPDRATVTADQGPALSIEKSADPLTYDSVGDVVGYEYVVTNIGNVTLSGPFTISDDKSSDEACPVTATLAPDQTITCTASYPVTQADLDGGSVTNVARAFATFAEEPVSSEPDTATVTAVQSPALTVVKTAGEEQYSEVGDVLTYEYVVTNSGNVTLAGPFTVADDRTTATCPSTASLLPGGSLVCAATYVVDQDDLDDGSVTNVARAFAQFDGDPVSSEPDRATVTADQGPALSIEKSADPLTYDSVGDVVGYEYVVTNIGNVTLSGPFTVADDKSSDESCPDTASLLPDASITCTASYPVTQADLDGGSVTNVARAFATFAEEPVSSEPDTATVTAVQSPALTVVKTAGEEQYSEVGDVLTYEYVVTNSGNVTLAGPFTIADDKSSDESCPQTLSLAPQGSITCEASYTVTQADLDAGSVTNVAAASNGTVTSPPDDATVPAEQAPALSLTKTAAQDGYDEVGDVITYSYVVTNTGDVTLAGPFTVDDDKADVTCPDTASLAPGQSLTCTAQHTVTQADLDAGEVTNVATATNGTVTSPPATETVVRVEVLPTTVPSPTVLPFVEPQPRALPFTGAPLLTVVALGATASLLGALLTGAGRRRRTGE